MNFLLIRLLKIVVKNIVRFYPLGCCPTKLVFLANEKNRGQKNCDRRENLKKTKETSGYGYLFLRVITKTSSRGRWGTQVLKFQAFLGVALIFPYVALSSNRSSHQRCSVEKGVLKNFANWLRPVTLLKRDSEIFKNTFFDTITSVVASLLIFYILYFVLTLNSGATGES